MKAYAEVIGDPVAHSRSPFIHNFWLGELGIDAEYRTCRVEAGKVGAYLSERRADPSWRGCNITIPHKETAYRLIVTERAGGLGRGEGDFGAINTIAHDPLTGAMTGFNTDVEGVTGPLARSLARREAAQRRALRIAIVGAGGAARAALWGLSRLCPGAAFTVLARRDEQARALLDAMGIPGTVKSIADASLEGMDVLLNASPLGMTGKPPLALSPAAMNRNAIIFDMVYAPLETPLLRQSRSLGFEAVDGLQMLVAQAAGAFQKFFGVPVPQPLVDEVHQRLARQ